jgi:SAM-dependent methyltransferase
MSTLNDFDQLIQEAEQQSFSGWDFSWLEGRYIQSPLSWDCPQIVRSHLPIIHSLLDMGTGGGELLASLAMTDALAPFPPDSWATESYLPNVPIARSRLEPFGVHVVQITDNDHLPFGDSRFDLIINRHELLSASEVFRLLKPDGKFITQQVGGKDNIRLNELLQERVQFEFSDWDLAFLCHELQRVGFQIVDQREELPEAVFYDIGAVVYYLKAIPWQVEGFTVEAYRPRLLAMYKEILQRGGLKVRYHRFYVEAIKPPGK